MTSTPTAFSLAKAHLGDFVPCAPCLLPPWARATTPRNASLAMKPAARCSIAPPPRNASMRKRNAASKPGRCSIEPWWRTMRGRKQARCPCFGARPPRSGAYDIASSSRRCVRYSFGAMSTTQSDSSNSGRRHASRMATLPPRLCPRRCTGECCPASSQATTSL